VSIDAAQSEPCIGLFLRPDVPNFSNNFRSEEWMNVSVLDHPVERLVKEERVSLLGNVVLGLISLALMAYLLYVIVRPGRF